MEKEKGFEQTDKHDALDERWFPEARRIAAFQTFQFMASTDPMHRATEQAAFVEGETENPVLDYPKLSMDDLKTRETDLLKLKEEIRSEEENEVIRRAYLWKLNEKIAEIRMLRATLTGDMRGFERYNAFVYGSPSEEIFQSSVATVRYTIIEAQYSRNPDLVRAAQELSDCFPNIPEIKNNEPVKEIERPNEATFEYLRDVTREQLADILADIPDKPEYTSEEVKIIFESVLGKIGADNWQVFVESGGSPRMNINSDTEKIRLPEASSTLKARLQKLIVHELGTHVACRQNGERSKLKLLRLGLDRYESGHDGVATLREQTLQQHFLEYPRQDRHLAISLAKGLDGTKRDFRGVYEIMVKYYLFHRVEHGENYASAAKNASNDAWNLCVDTFRGTDCKTPGVCYMKDIIYHEGNIGIWRLAAQNKDIVHTFSVGVFDPTNTRHMWVLSQLGISDEDLEELKQ